MPKYLLANDAARDLTAIAHYTLKTWGPAQTAEYESALIECFQSIANRSALSRAPIPHRPEIRMTRCRSHYVFYVESEDGPALILAVLHENMDLLSRLSERRRASDG